MIDYHVEESGNIIIISFKGEIIIENAEKTEDVFFKYLEKKPKVIGFDLNDVSFIDSSGLSVFIKFLKYAHDSSIDMVLINLKKTARNLFISAGIDAMFTFMTRSEFERTYLE